MEEQKSPNRFLLWLRESFAVKMLVIGFILILLLIPQQWVRNLVGERERQSQYAKREVASMWGNYQTITGPYLIVPISRSHVNSEGEAYTTEHKITLLPDSLHYEGYIDQESRQRGIFEVLLYSSSGRLSGSFDLSTIRKDIDLKKAKVHWEKAIMELRISDLAGVKENIVFTINDKNIETKPGIPGQYQTEGVHLNPNLEAGQESFAFDCSIALNGRESLHIAPVGKINTIQMESDWPSPKFDGNWLPEDHTITSDGFHANWKVLAINRNYPQVWEDAAFQLQNGRVGVILIDPVNHYTKNHRAVRYSFLVVAFVFLVYFIFEVSKKQRLHPMIYLLVGLNLSLFFLLLLALSEHIGFNRAYFTAAAAHIVVLGLYSSAYIKNKWALSTLITLIAVIFGYIYILLQLEDYALLAGTLGLFAIVSIVMLVSRKIEWGKI